MLSLQHHCRYPSYLLFYRSILLMLGVRGQLATELCVIRSIQAYTRLMMKSYLKSRLYEQLKLHGHIPDLDKDTDPAARIDSDIRNTLI